MAKLFKQVCGFFSCCAVRSRAVAVNLLVAFRVNYYDRFMFRCVNVGNPVSLMNFERTSETIHILSHFHARAPYAALPLSAAADALFSACGLHLCAFLDECFDV